MFIEDRGWLVLTRSGNDDKSLTEVSISPQAIKHLAKLDLGAKMFIRAEPKWNGETGEYVTKLSFKAPRYFEIERFERLTKNRV